MKIRAYLVFNYVKEIPDDRE